MDYFSNATSESTSFVGAAAAVPIASYAILSSQSPLTLISYSLTAFLVWAIGFLGTKAYRPKVHPRSPAFTKDTIPIIGSWGFITRQWSFWKNATKESKTGNFSLWHGPHHVVGVTGPAARKLVLDHPDLDLVKAQALLPFGIQFWPAKTQMHGIFTQQGPRARNNTYFLKTLLEMGKGPRLDRVLKDVLKDAREYYGNLSTTNGVGVINAPVIWPTVLKQSSRIYFADDLARDPALYAEACKHLEVILHTFSPFYAFCSWIPEPSMLRRKAARKGLTKIAEKVYNDRITGKAPRSDDCLQLLIDRGDPKENIIEFCVSGFFISTANAHIIFPRLIETLATHAEWQEKCYQEMQAVANKHATIKAGSLVDRLATVPLHAWENSFPILEMCRDEVTRAWTSFPVARLNVGTTDIEIPGSNEVIPAGSFAAYNSTEVNFDPNLFPDPHKFDPERFAEGRREFEKEPFGNFGFGVGQHPCAGKRWGKLQQNILVVHALAQYRWTRCEESGKVITDAAQRLDMGADLDDDKKFDLPAAYCRYEVRE